VVVSGQSLTDTKKGFGFEAKTSKRASNKTPPK